MIIIILCIILLLLLLFILLLLLILIIIIITEKERIVFKLAIISFNISRYFGFNALIALLVIIKKSLFPSLSRAVFAC